MTTTITPTTSMARRRPGHSKSGRQPTAGGDLRLPDLLITTLSWAEFGRFSPSATDGVAEWRHRCSVRLATVVVAAYATVDRLALVCVESPGYRYKACPPVEIHPARLLLQVGKVAQGEAMEYHVKALSMGTITCVKPDGLWVHPVGADGLAVLVAAFGALQEALEVYLVGEGYGASVTHAVEMILRSVGLGDRIRYRVGLGPLPIGDRVAMDWLTPRRAPGATLIHADDVRSRGATAGRWYPGKLCHEPYYLTDDSGRLSPAVSADPDPDPDLDLAGDLPGPGWQPGVDPPRLALGRYYQGLRALLATHPPGHP